MMTAAARKCASISRLGAIGLCLAFTFLLASCHQVHEARARKLSKSAIESFFERDFDRSLEHSEIALQLGSEDPTLHRIRAAIFMMRHDAALALNEADAGIAQIKAINEDPHHQMGTIDDSHRSLFHYLRASALQALGQAQEGRDAFIESVTLDPDNAAAQNNLSWLLSTTPDKMLRNGELAVLHGETACELTDWKDPGTLDTLAAAYAEAGDFEKAVEWQAKAIEIFEKGAGEVPPEEVEDFRSRLERYRNQEPYREDPVAAFGEPAPSGDDDSDESIE